MAYDEYQQDRINQILSDKKLEYHSKKMMGGLCYMLDDKMLCGLVSDQLMARIGPDRYEEVLGEDGVHEMTFTGRKMKGYVFIDLEAVDTDELLERWLQYCIDFNPLAKSSKKRKKKA